MKLFNLDKHISLSSDFEYVFNKLGHSVDVKTQSQHSFLINKKRDVIPLLEGNQWLDLISNKLWDSFYNTYNKELELYNGFLVGYPPSYSLLYEKFKVPIIIHIAIRYEYPFNFNKEEWEFFNNWLRTNIDNKKVILLANNKYDLNYTKCFLNRDVFYIPSLGAYTGSKYAPNNGPLLYSSRNRIIEMPDNVVWKEDALKGFYSWGDLYSNYKAMIIIPYQISTMSIFELYTANMPLLFPSESMLLKLYQEDRALTEMHWNRYFKGTNGSLVFCNCKFDPNDFKNMESVQYWVKYADFYNGEWFPHITYFESFSHLNEIIKSIDFINIHEKMKYFNKDRESNVLSLWRGLLNGIFS